MEAAYRPSAQDRLRVRARKDLLARMAQLTGSAGARLLDLGGGTGAATVVFAAEASERVVLEPRERRIAQGRAAHAPVRFVSGVAESLPWLENRFERVTSLVSYHHFGSKDEALREAKRVLAPGGRLVLFDFDPRTPRGRWVAWWERKVHGGAMEFETPEQISGRFRAAGFARVRSEPFRWGAFVLGER